MNNDKPMSMLQLAEAVSNLTAQIHERNGNTTVQNDTEDPKFDALRISLNEVIQELQLLVNGPKITLRSLYGTHYDLAAHQLALEFDFFEKVPLEGTISISSLSEKTGLIPDVVGRVLRLLATQQIFREDQEDEFAHTTLSATIAKEENLKASFHMQMDELFQAASETANFFQQPSSLLDEAHCPFNMRFNMPIFEYYKENPEKGERFGKALAGATQLDRNVNALRDDFDWKNTHAGPVVDVGGADGAVSLLLAEKWPHLSFIVQDTSPALLSQGLSQLPQEYKSRFTFQEHNFFNPQTVTNASVFFIRQCLHNWTDPNCIKILRGFVPALEKCDYGTPLLINESILPRLGHMSRSEERLLRHVDMSMMINLGARQRSADDFLRLAKAADERFEIVKEHNVGPMGLLELQLVRG